MMQAENQKPEATQAAQPATAPAPSTLDIAAIMAILPHRYPFLLIDRVLEITPMKRIVALKNVTINEPFFTGHFPDFPIMPGVLVVEAIAQAGGALLLTEVPERDKKVMLFTGIERAKFRRPIVPGDQLRIEVEVLNWRVRAVKMEGKAYVDGKLACEAVIMCAVIDRVPPATSPVGVPAASPQPAAGAPAPPDPAPLEAVASE